jgi:hypothetical protein
MDQDVFFSVAFANVSCGKIFVQGEKPLFPLGIEGKMHCPGESSYCNSTFAPKKAYFLGNFPWNIALGKGHYLQRQHICPRRSFPLRQHKQFPK